MPRFIVPVAITLTARDAQHARSTVEYSSLHSLEIPGLIRITVSDATRAHRTIRQSRQLPASVRKLRQQLLALRSPAPAARPLAPQVLALAQLLQGGTEALANLIEAALSPD